MAFAQAGTLKAQLPVLTTSAGQSNDVNTVNIVLEEAGIAYDYCDVPNAELLSAGVGLAGKTSGEGFHVESTTDTAKYPKGTPFKTVIFAIGASLKGMGASGLTVDAEEARVKKLVDLLQEKQNRHRRHPCRRRGDPRPGRERQRTDDRRRRPVRRRHRS